MVTGPKYVDLVLVIDASASMRPCIDGLRAHLRELLKPMQGHVANVRFGVVALSASRGASGILFRLVTMAGGGESIGWLYSNPRQYQFFTDDPDEVIRRLDGLTVGGDEDNLTALDIAMDHPFGPSNTHKRVIALFSDEKFETGVRGLEILRSLPQVIEKLHARRIKLFCAVPISDAAQHLAQANGSEIEDVGNATGLASVDFRMLLNQMGKSISVSVLQGSVDESYKSALFGQDKWSDATETFLDADSA